MFSLQSCCGVWTYLTLLPLDFTFPRRNCKYFPLRRYRRAFKSTVNFSLLWELSSGNEHCTEPILLRNAMGWANRRQLRHKLRIYGQLWPYLLLRTCGELYDALRITVLYLIQSLKITESEMSVVTRTRKAGCASDSHS
ncbi:hypothetical protein B0H19DRAFT_1190693 [Mycena capillaripes]|nr:hypothetical protein B0H19DRAFT_1190693 [Mycena capillaripes]